MSAPRPCEEELLEKAEAALKHAARLLRNAAKARRSGKRVSDTELRLQVLEACAARFGGFDLRAFHTAFRTRPSAPAAKLLELAAPVAECIEQSSIHPSLALSALARETLSEADRRNTGAYHTDFRLANHLGAQVAPRLGAGTGMATGASGEALNAGKRATASLIATKARVARRSGPAVRSERPVGGARRIGPIKVIDPACGAGILLVALSIAVCGLDRAQTAKWLAHSVFAADRSPVALRGALLALASLTDSVPVLKKMRSHWLCGDSLLADPKVWRTMARQGFDAVIGNPPWEKVKLSRHEFLRSSGTERHYGAATADLDEHRFNKHRDAVANYSRRLLARYPDLANGEPDLYIAFTALFFELCRPGGTVAALVPGGLIRSRGTQSVRTKLFEASSTVTISIIDNRARFFSIDTRFKFLLMCLAKAAAASAPRRPITLLHERGTANGVERIGHAALGRAHLARVRSDFSLPEVRTPAEWQTFLKIAEAGCSWEDAAYHWAPQFCREVDMTKERAKFKSAPTAVPTTTAARAPAAAPAATQAAAAPPATTDDAPPIAAGNTGGGSPGDAALAVVEGRMVLHHRFGAKGHMSGTGRKAIWKPHRIGASELRPQFWIDRSDLPATSLERTDHWRAGFCDIAGQTNERALMAALIPPGVVCGNKVPTILFPQDDGLDRLRVWVAIANSFVFDWMLRRVLTTTVNYFLLQSIPLPRLVRDGLPWNRLATCAEQLQQLDTAAPTRTTHERCAQLRADIDAEVALAYGLSVDDLKLILQDFPLLDRGQPPLAGETQSTVTRDILLATAARRMGGVADPWHDRAAQAREGGAVAYVPAEFTGSSENLSPEDSAEPRHG